MRTCPHPLYSAALFLACSLASAETDYWPTCDEPQPIAPPQVLDAASRVDLAWNGTVFAGLYIDAVGETGSRLFFQRVLADGTAAAPPVLITTEVMSGIGFPQIVWDGDGYGVSWCEPDRHRIRFARLGVRGERVIEPTNVSGTWSDIITGLSLASGPTGYLIAFGDDLGASGRITRVWLSKQGAVVAQDDAYRGFAFQPEAVWSTTGQTFVTVWQVWPYGTGDDVPKIYSRSDDATSAAVLVTDTGYEVSLTDSPLGPALAWWDSRNGGDFFFSTLHPDGHGLLGEPTGLFVSPPPARQDPKLVGTGAEFAVFWKPYDVWFQRVSGAGQAVGQPHWAAYGGPSYSFDTEFARHGYLTATTYEVLATQALGCHSPQSPLCPESVDAYSVTGSTAVISWLPVPDDRTDIACYEIYRNDNLVGRTPEAFFNDTGLAPGSTYDYDIRTMNAAQMVSAPCPTSNITVTPSDALQLRVERDGPDLELFWFGRSASVFRVMRGTSPRSLTEIRRTTELQATDLGAATGSTCYFYSIDPPN